MTTKICKACGEVGHIRSNSKKCTLHRFYVPPQTREDVTQQKQRKCSWCHSTEHTARTCKEAIEAKKQEELDRKNFCGMCDSSHEGECPALLSYKTKRDSSN